MIEESNAVSSEVCQNIIENMSRYTELWERVIEESNMVSSEVCQNIIESMSRYIKVVIMADKDHTMY